MRTHQPGFATKLAIVISVMLLAVNLLLGIVLTSNSQAAIKTLIDNRMLDISKTAADMLDGDVLAVITAEDKDTPEYRAINDTLAVFQDNIDLKYIYCIRDNGNDVFTFTIDPTIVDPGIFGDPIVTTEALKTAATGVSAVDMEPYSDAWGNFYSAYSPVFDSKGNVAGIVAVDFSADWYNQQISKQSRAILIGSALSMAVGILLVFVATASLRKQLKTILGELGEIANDVDELTREINPDAPLPSAKNVPTDEIRELGNRIHSIKEDLRNYTMDLHSQANSMITALSSEYRSVYYINLDKDEGICYQSHSQLDNGLHQGEPFVYMKTLTEYANQYVTEHYREEFLKFLAPENIRKALEKERILTFRYTVDRDDQESYEMVRIAGVRHPEDREDHMVHAIGLGFTDVDLETRRTLAQRQALSDALTAAEGANKAKTAFLSNMSHEIRTPMNAIIGLDKIALNDSTISATTRDHLEKIGSSADHLLSIINDILDMSRIEAGRMTLRTEVFSLPSLLKQVHIMIDGQCKEKNLNLHWDVHGITGDFYIGDDIKLKQVLINILSNSVKFTPDGGEIFFQSEQVRHYENKTVFRFMTRDTGIGMSKEFLPKLFEPFSQEDLSTKSKYGSTGLGLTITKSIVEMMNGDIQVESEKNIGTSFTVTVTLTDPEQQINNAYDISPQDIHALVVDNEPIDSEYVKIELEKAGVIAATALSGAQAVEMVRLRHARRESFNLILIDREMPDMDGVEAARQIRSIIGNDSAIIILTSFHWDETLENIAEAGIDSFMAKPLQANDIISQFRQAFALKRENTVNRTDLRGKRVLVAEDIAVTADIIRMLLEMRETEVDHAENGRIAVDKFSSHAQGYYDAILMDMRMPEMDGLEATQTIRALDRADAKTVPIIALTANAFDEDVQRSLQAGMNAHLSKPVEPEQLYATLEELIFTSSHEAKFDETV